MLPESRFPAAHNVLLPLVCRSSFWSWMGLLLRSTLPEHTCSMVTRHHATTVSGLLLSSQKTWLGFKLVVTLSSTLSCSGWATWYFSTLLATSNIFFVPNNLLPYVVHISFCFSLQLPLVSGIWVILPLYCPIIWKGCSHVPKYCPVLLVPCTHK